MLNKILYITIFSIILACNSKSKAPFDVSSHYDFKKPVAYFEMPHPLSEISGIDILNGTQFVTHNDEEGYLFIYNTRQNAIEKQVKFGKDGDYEDVAIVGSTAYVLRSDGVLFEVVNFQEAPAVTVHNTFLSKKDDVEGLCYDRENNRLLLACKGKKDKTIYAFSLEKKELNPDPVFEIDPKAIEDKFHIKATFSPSAIGIHPISKNYYVLSSVGKMLAEFDNNGNLIHVFNIDYSRFEQPEGLCFSKNGDIYISNEANEGKANILKFNYLQ